MVKGIDCATKLTATTAAGIKAAGYEFAGRYLVPNSGSLAWKALTKAEAEAITGAGLRLLTVWETTADRVKGGMSAGHEDGVRAYQCAKEIGMPTNGVIYFAVDYEAQAFEMRTIADYLNAAKAQIGEYGIGVYGSYSVIEAIASQYICDAYWQCLAWSYGKKSSHLNVYQGVFGQTVAGVPVDINECPDMDAAGIWTYPATDKGGATNMPTYTSPMIGHASIDENGRASGGQAGDQTGKEVCVRTWYNSSWNKMIRPKSADVAEKMARFVEAVCNGNMVGYDQGQRNTLRTYAKAAGWDGSKITTKCETDCSAFMTVAAEAAGIDVEYTEGWNAPVTGNMCDRFKATGAFDVLTDKKYLTSPDYVRRGDILVRTSGHTAMVLTNGSLSGAEPTEDTQDTIVNYQGKVTASSLNCRITPNGTILSVYPNGAIVTITKERNGWGYTGDGWVSLEYIQKITQTETPIVKEDDDMDQVKFNEMFKVAMTEYRKDLQDNDCGAWSEADRNWAVLTGLIVGMGVLPTGEQNYAWADMVTREQVAALFHRFAKMIGQA